MKKKLFKYIKFFMSVTLILSLVAPSYASLSASDGSAFVTKAEFDSALADFNSRLTTFEAGINSKIDSQVTSYLDRNGIWQGKDQTLTYDNFGYDMSNFNYWADNCATITTGANVHYLTPDCFIKKTNKAGMLYLTFDVASVKATDKRCCQEFSWYDAYNNNSRYTTGSKLTTPCTSRCLDVDIYQADADATGISSSGVLKTSVNIGAATAATITDDLRNAAGTAADNDTLFSVNSSSYNQHHWINVPLVASLGKRICLTFVEKDKSLWFQLKDSLSFTSTNMVSAMSESQITKTDGSWGKLGLNNITAKIY